MENDALVQAVMDSLFVKLEASGRHVHVTADQARQLFGHDLTPERPLSQPGQFLARERVTVTGPKGAFHNVAVLGPARKEAQVEVSLTDARRLGLTVPIRQSGNVANSPGATVTGPVGQVTLTQGVIAAQRHIHMTPDDAKKFGVTDGQTVSLEVYTHRPLIFRDTVVRVSPQFATYVHLDHDEANACAMAPGDVGRIL